MAGNYLRWVGDASLSTRTHSLAGVGHCPLANGHVPSAGPPSVCRIAGPYRNWRPQGRSVGRAEPVLPLADRRQRRSAAGVWRRCAEPCLCVVRWSGTVVADRQWHAAATAAGTPGRSQPVSPPAATRRGRLRPAGDRSNGPPGHSSCAGPTAGPGPALGGPGYPLHSAGQWPVDPASGPILFYMITIKYIILIIIIQ
jgi:hypothetical protein